MSKKEIEQVCFWLPNHCTGKMDVLTPHKMVVVFLIQEYMRLKKTSDSTTEEQPPRIELTFDDRKRFCLLLLKLIQYPDMSYRDLYGLLTSSTYRLHPVHLEEFAKLMKLLKTVGVDVLFDLYNEIDKLIGDNSTSFIIGIVGLHLRKVFVMMDKMNFQEMMELYQATIAYYNKGIITIEQEVGRDGSFECDSLLQLSLYLPVEPSDHGALAAKWSLKQSELFIAQQSDLLKENEVKALEPKELQRRLEEIIQDRPQYSQAYFLQYLNNLRVRDFYNAIQSLHRSFDRGSTSTGGAVGAGSSSMPFVSETNTKDYQYSSLNLAILHAHFGHRSQALVSLEECIMLAQESEDTACLHLAHAWLSWLNSEDTPLPERNCNSSLIHATSLGTLTEMRSWCSTGSELPSRVFGILMLNDHLNSRRSMMDLVATGTAVRTALWTVYGNHQMASLCAQILLNADLKSLDKIYNGEAICQVLCSIVIWLALLGEFNLAIVVLQHAKDRFLRYPLSRDWLVADYYVTLVRAIYRGHWVEASTECEKLYGLDPPLALLQLAHVTLAKLDITTARTIIRRLLANKLEPLIRVRAMILHANVYIHMHHSDALTVLAEAKQIARKNYLDYEVALVDLHLAYLFLVRLKVAHQALVPMKASLETILANGPIYDKSRALFLFGRVLVEAEDKETRLQKLLILLPIFEEAIEIFEKLECYSKAKDVYIYLATTFHLLGAQDERNRFSYRYRVLEEQFPTEQQYLNIFF